MDGLIGVYRWQWCWWLYDGDWFEMLVAESLCWRLFSLCWWFSQCIKSVTNISNLSPTHLVSNIRHQHRCNRFLWLNQRVFVFAIFQLVRLVVKLQKIYSSSQKYFSINRLVNFGSGLIWRFFHFWGDDKKGI